MKITIEIATECSDWRSKKEVNIELFSNITQNILARYNGFKPVKELELSILLTDDAKMQSLNKEFRDIEKSTNVLSFSDLEINWQELLEFQPLDDYMYLGDIAFGYQTIANEAEAKKISFEDHFKHLLVHAILHLIGYDHVNDKDAQVMEALEINILSDYNIKSPY